MMVAIGVSICGLTDVLDRAFTAAFSNAIEDTSHVVCDFTLDCRSDVASVSP
jgi:hypothetical protein